MPKQTIFVTETPNGGEYRVDDKGNLVNNRSVVIKANDVASFVSWLKEEIERFRVSRSMAAGTKD